MTLCLAALCKEDDEPRAVVAADRMVIYPGFIEYEHATSKIGETTQFTLAMVAGNALVGNRLVKETATALKGTSPRVDGALRPLQEASQLLAEREWPQLYDSDQLARNEVPVAAAIYADDMYVDRELSERTAARIRGLHVC